MNPAEILGRLEILTRAAMPTSPLSTDESFKRKQRTRAAYKLTQRERYGFFLDCDV